MKVFVFYDIQEDKKRRKVIDRLVEYGFVRVQFSVFLGEIESKKLEKLKKKMEKTEVFENPANSILYFPICEKDFDNAYFIDKKRLYKGIKERNQLFF